MTHSGTPTVASHRPMVERMEPRTLFSGGWGAGGAAFEPRGERVAQFARFDVPATAAPTPVAGFSFFAFARSLAVMAAPASSNAVAEPVLKPFAGRVESWDPPASTSTFGDADAAWDRPPVGWASPVSARSGDVLVTGGTTTATSPTSSSGHRHGGGNDLGGSDRPGDFAWSGKWEHFEWSPTATANVTVVIGVGLPAGSFNVRPAGAVSGEAPAGAGSYPPHSANPPSTSPAPPSRPSLQKPLVVGSSTASRSPGESKPTAAPTGADTSATSDEQASRGEPPLVAAARAAGRATAARPDQSASKVVAAAGERSSADAGSALAGRVASASVAAAPVQTALAAADDSTSGSSASAYFLRTSSVAAGLVLRAAPAAAMEFVEWSGSSSPFWSGTIGAIAGDAVGGEVPSFFGTSTLGLAPWAGPAATDVSADEWVWKATAAVSLAAAYGGYVYCKAAAACRAQDERERQAAAKAAASPAPSNGRAKYVKSRVLA